jgi:hypothetical protein
VVYTDLSNVYIAGAAATTGNASAIRKHALALNAGRLTLGLNSGSSSTSSEDGLWLGTDVNFFRTGANAATITVSSGLTLTGSIKTSAPSGGTAAAWKLGTVAVVSPTSPNRTIELDVSGTIYYLAAKTTNN